MARTLARLALSLTLMTLLPACAATAEDGVYDGVIVDAACGQCQFGLTGESCDLAVRIGGQAWFVEGTTIDDHGDAHADDGFCNAVRRARVSGRVVGERFVVTAFELLPESDA